MNERGKQAAEQAGKDPSSVRKFKRRHNALRHSFCSYRLAAIKNAAQLALEAGNTPQMIFANYRQLLTESEAAKWFTEIAIDDERLQQAAKVDPQDKFSLGFSNLLETLMLERMEQNEAIVARFVNDPEFQRAVAARLATEAYERLGGVAKSLEGKLYSKRKKTL